MDLHGGAKNGQLIVTARLQSSGPMGTTWLPLSDFGASVGFKLGGFVTSLVDPRTIKFLCGFGRVIYLRA